MDLHMETTTTDERFPKATDQRISRRKLRNFNHSSLSRWRTEAEQQIYSSRLLHALRHVRSTSSVSQPRTRAIREAADRALAFAARGRTRWSRAILLSSSQSLKLKATRKRPRKPVSPPKMGANTQHHPATPVLPALQLKAKILGMLVPGCRKLTFPALLDETSDYIAALQMQIQAMTALAEILSSSGMTTFSGNTI